MKKSLQGTFLTIFFIAAIIFVTGCKKSADTPYPVPLIGTNSVISQLSSTTAISGGLIFNVDAITANGVCWSSTNQTPTIADSKTTDTVATHWVSNLTGLTPNTTYYLRAYATGSSGTGYGGVVTFKTSATAGVLTGTVTTLAGSPSGSLGYADGTGSSVLFDGPQAIAYNPLTSLLYVSDQFNNQLRTVTTANGTTKSLLGNAAIGFANGTLTTAQFYGIKGLSFDAQGNIYAADIGNNMIRKISATGAVTTFAGNGLPGYVNGAVATAEFNNPQATTVDAQGNVYVADRSNNLIRKITSTGTVSTFTGYLAINGYPQNTVPGFADGNSATAQFNYPCAMAMDSQGNIFVADLNNKAIRKVATNGDVTTYAGGGNFPNLIGLPTGIAVDAQGNLFVSDATGRIFEITAARVLYQIAGSQNVTGYADGVGKAAKFNSPQGLTLDGQGNLYVADFGNNVIRKITISVQ